jgi:hypothetical protein
VNDPAHIALVAVLILLAKHLIFDFLLQTAYQYQNKGIYGHPGGLLHAGLHVFGTAFLFLYIAPSAALAAQILVGEFIIHYHIDWTKEQVVHHLDLTSDRPGFWWVLGIDQFLHGATYVAIVWILMNGLP